MLFKRIALIVLVVVNTVFSVPTIASTQEEISSLEQELLNLSESNHERLALLVKLVRNCWRSCPDKAIDYANRAQQLLETFPDPKLEAEMIAFIVRVYIKRGDYETAQQLTEQGLIAGRKSGNEVELSRVLFNQAVIYSNNNKHILAENIYLELLQVYTRLDNKSGMASTLNNLGKINQDLRNVGAALEYFQKALPLYEEIDNKANYANTLVNIAKAYRNIHNQKQAQATALRALEYIEQVNAPHVKLHVLQTLANIYEESGKHQQAKILYDQVLDIAKQQKMQPILAATNAVLSKVYLNLGNVVQAKYHIEIAKSHLKEHYPKKYRWHVHTEEARIAIYEQNWSLAEQLLNIALSEKDPQEYLDSESSTFLLAVELQEKTGNWQKATELYKHYVTLFDQQLQKNRQSRTEQFAELFQKTEKERQIAVLEQKNSEQQLQVLTEQQGKRQTLYIATVLVLMLIATIFLVIQRRKVAKVEAELLKTKLETSKRMFSDISHELRTPLTIIKLKIEELEYQLAADPQQAYSIMHEKIKGFDLLIDDISLLAQADAEEIILNKQPIKLTPFFDTCFEELTALAAKKQLDVERQINFQPDAVCFMDEQRIHQVLTNLFTNSIRYTDSPGTIRLSATIENSALTIMVEDSAPGLDDEQLTKVFERMYRADQAINSAISGSGLGLAISKRLVAAHGGSIKATHAPLGGVQLSFSIQLEENVHS